MHIEFHVCFLLIIPIQNEYLINAIICYSIFLNKVLRETMLVIASFLGHISCLYLGTIYVWVTSRLPLLPCAFIFSQALLIFSTRFELWNRSIVELLSNNITFLMSNLIYLIWLCLNKTSSIL